MRWEWIVVLVIAGLVGVWFLFRVGRILWRSVRGHLPAWGARHARRLVRPDRRVLGRHRARLCRLDRGRGHLWPGAVCAALAHIGLVAARKGWRWSYPFVLLCEALILVAVVVVIGLTEHWHRWHGALGSWSQTRLTITVGAFLMISLLAWWRGRWSYFFSAVSVMAAGTLWSAGREPGAVVLAAGSILLFVALTFSRVTLRITAAALLGVLVIMAVRFPPHEEATLILQRDQAVNEAATPGTPPANTAGVDGPIRALEAWIGHLWSAITHPSATERPPVPGLEPWQWVLLALLVVFVYRYLEVLAARKDPGPVVITAIRDSQDLTTKDTDTPPENSARDNRPRTPVRARWT